MWKPEARLKSLLLSIVTNKNDYLPEISYDAILKRAARFKAVITENVTLVIRRLHNGQAYSSI